MPKDYPCQICDWFEDKNTKIYLDTSYAYFMECPVCNIPVVITKKHGERKIDDNLYNMIIKQMRLIWPNSIPRKNKQHDEDHVCIHVEVKI